MAENTEEFLAISLYLDCLTSLNKFTDIDTFFKSLSDEALKNKYIISSMQRIQIIKNNSDGPSLDEIKAQLASSPKNLELIIKLSDKYFSEGQLDECFELLIKNYKINNDKIKSKLKEFFEALGVDHEKTKEYRKNFKYSFFLKNE